jgi:dTDP-4-dehydrorhamnose reductase
MNDVTSKAAIKVLVLGASGMLGNAVLRLFAQSPGFATVGSARSADVLRSLPAELRDHVIAGSTLRTSTASHGSSSRHGPTS